MSDKPEISVILICSNQENLIKQSIDSVLTQFFEDFELIVVDYGSEDKTYEIIQSYKDSRIKSIKLPTVRPGTAVNAGLKQSRGKYIALMEGEDISKSSRLGTQLRQMQNRQLDMVFCMPEIINAYGDVIERPRSSHFYQNEINNTSELYRILFDQGNSLCVSSCFMRRSAFQKTGFFRYGLIRLYDFEYWVRACKSGFKIKVFIEPLIQYRSLKNRLPRNNDKRAKIERKYIYRSFFEGASHELINNAFYDQPGLVLSAKIKKYLELQEALILISHPDRSIKEIGKEKVIDLYEDDDIRELASNRQSIDLQNLLNEAESDKKEFERYHERLPFLYGLLRVLKIYKNLISPTIKYQLNAEGVITKIQSHLDSGKDDEALRLAKGIWQARKEVKRSTSTRKSLQDFIKKFLDVYLIWKDKIFELQQVFLFNLANLYIYSQKNGLLIDEATPEEIQITKPQLIGGKNIDLKAGKALCPNPYIARLNNVIIAGSASLAILEGKTYFNDELVNYPSDEFGIKSDFIRLRHNNKVILNLRIRSPINIKEGALISCDNNFDYYRWFVEALPKLVYLDSLEDYRELPILIPDGLNENLETALQKLNIHKREIIRLRAYAAYRVKNLICPGPLSRVLERNSGEIKFDEDIAVSHKWISRTADLLIRDVHSHITPWRKLFLLGDNRQNNIQNLADIETMLMDRRFEFVDLNNKSFDYQINMFAQASIVISPGGSLLTNMLFFQPGTHVIALMSIDDNLNYYKWSQLADMRDLNLKFLLGERLYNASSDVYYSDDTLADLKNSLKEIDE